MSQWYSNFGNCSTHANKAISVCLKLGCTQRLVCPECLNQLHRGHIDNYILPISKFTDSIHREFQRPELDRLKRINYSADLISHIENEFKYLVEKTTLILKRKSEQLTKLVQAQAIHQRSFQNLLDQIQFLQDGKIFDEGVNIVLPLMAVDGGVQESITKMEREKVRITLKVKEQINQIKTVLDGLFFLGEVRQTEQGELKGSESRIQKYEQELFNSVQRKITTPLTNSSINLNQNKYAFSNNYKEFADNLYPKYEKIDYVDILATNPPPAKFEESQQQVDKDTRFRLFGVLEHQTLVHGALRLLKGQILTCSNQLIFWNYPQLRQIQATAFNYGIKSVLELTEGVIVCQNNDAIQTYEQKDDRWLPKGEFITPGIGAYAQMCLSDAHCAQDLLCILSQSQLMIYVLSDKTLYGDYQRHLHRRPLEQLMKHINPMVYQHKFDCKCVAFEHDGTRILIGDSGGRVYRWKIGNTYNVEAMVQAHSTSVEGVVALSDGRVCSVSLDGAIKLWEQSLNDTALQLVKHRSQVTSVATYQKDTFFTGDVKGKIQVWKVTTSITPLYEVSAHNDQICSIFYSQTWPQQLITASYDKTVKIWTM